MWARVREREPDHEAKNMIVDFRFFFPCKQELARRLRVAKKKKVKELLQVWPHTAVYVIQADSVAAVSLLCCSALCGSVRLFSSFFPFF